MKKIYGLELSITLYGCEYKILRSKKKLEKFLVEAINITGLQPFGKPLTKRFNKGYTFFQFLTTSSITGHCIEEDNIVFINVFSCGIYDKNVMARFAKRYFRAKWMRRKPIIHKDI